jgi:hypothetical protein
MRGKRRHVAAIAVALMAAASPALAQVNDQLAAMATAWTNDNDFTAVVKTHGAACITPILQALPDAIKQAIAAAPDLDAALDTLEMNARNDVVAQLEPCVSTMILGDQAWNWVQATAAGANAERQGQITVCLMEAVAPLSSEAKQRIYLGTDFGAGVQALLAERPDLAGDVQMRVQACL